MSVCAGFLISPAIAKLELPGGGDIARAVTFVWRRDRSFVAFLGGIPSMAETSIMEPTQAEQWPAPKASVTSKPRGSRVGWAAHGCPGRGCGRVWRVYLSRSGNGGSGHGGQGRLCRGFIAVGHPVAKRHGGLKPTKGGMEKTTNQPGTIRAFEFAPLYSKVSGYLKELNVDRGATGSRRGSSWPRSTIRKWKSPCSRRRRPHALPGDGKQAEAKVKTAEAGVKAAEASQPGESTLEQKVAQRHLPRSAGPLTGWPAAMPSSSNSSMSRKTSTWRPRPPSTRPMRGSRPPRPSSPRPRRPLSWPRPISHRQVGVRDLGGQPRRRPKSSPATRVSRPPFDGVITFRGEGVHRGASSASATEGSRNRS